MPADPHFDPIPPGAVLSREYLERLQGAAAHGANARPMMPAFGGGSGDGGPPGPAFLYDPQLWVIGRLTELPDAGDSSSGYSWVEQYPGVNGTWGDKPATERLEGDNGTVSLDDPHDMAFEAAGDQAVPVDTVVLLFRAYRAGTDAPGQVWVFWRGGPAADCATPSAPPAGWTCTDPACCEYFVTSRLNNGQCEYRLERLCLANGQFQRCFGPYSTTRPTTLPDGSAIVGGADPDAGVMIGMDYTDYRSGQFDNYAHNV